jgi:hypothetical protein
MSRLPDEASFLKDVAGHEMTVRHDDGLYRSARFCKPKSWSMGFDITTWPGYLCISGDMGCYVFSRVPDMFEFFRCDIPGKTGLHVDLGYWAQKVAAADRADGLKEYSPDLFRAGIARWLDDAEASPELRKAVADEVLAYADDGEHEAMRAALDFEHEGFRFDDFYEVAVREFTYRFVWACYAIAWAVTKYDAHKEASLAIVAKGA